jgi:hypothetical protein
MQERSFWNHWAQILHHWGLAEPVVTLLDASGPLHLLLAQLVYLGQPFAGGSVRDQQWLALATMLEDKQESRSFAAFLREGDLQ